MNINQEQFKNILPKRPENSHKGTFGHVLNVAGSEFYTGAAYFSSVSALKVGCGLVTLASVPSVIKAVSALSPDIIFMPVEKLKNIDNFQAVSIGCGLSQGRNAVKIFKKVLNLLKNSETPVIIDADGLNILSRHCEDMNNLTSFLLPRPLRETKRTAEVAEASEPVGAGTSEREEFQGEERALEIRVRGITLPKNLILTPHPKELARLIDATVENILENPELWAKKCCEKFNCTTVLKLHKTIVVDNYGNLYVNNTGNSALSHGGSGDVLTGMISGFSAQGMKTFEASCLAVYLHGLAGELASKDLTEYSTLASDLINYIPKVIKTFL